MTSTITNNNDLDCDRQSHKTCSEMSHVDGDGLSSDEDDVGFGFNGGVKLGNTSHSSKSPSVRSDDEERPDTMQETIVNTDGHHVIDQDSAPSLKKNAPYIPPHRRGADSTTAIAGHTEGTSVQANSDSYRSVLKPQTLVSKLQELSMRHPRVLYGSQQQEEQLARLGVGRDFHPRLFGPLMSPDSLFQTLEEALEDERLLHNQSFKLGAVSTEHEQSSTGGLSDEFRCDTSHRGNDLPTFESIMSTAASVHSEGSHSIYPAAPEHEREVVDHQGGDPSKI